MKRAMLLASSMGAAGPWGLTAEGWWLGGQRILSHQEKGPKQRGNTKGTATLLGTPRGDHDSPYLQSSGSAGPSLNSQVTVFSKCVAWDWSLSWPEPQLPHL